MTLLVLLKIAGGYVRRIRSPDEQAQIEGSHLVLWFLQNGVPTVSKRAERHRATNRCRGNESRQMSSVIHECSFDKSVFHRLPSLLNVSRRSFPEFIRES
jgi:hypothetical protein